MPGRVESVDIRTQVQRHIEKAKATVGAFVDEYPAEKFTTLDRYRLAETDAWTLAIADKAIRVSISGLRKRMTYGYRFISDEDDIRNQMIKNYREWLGKPHLDTHVPVFHADLTLAQFYAELQRAVLAQVTSRLLDVFKAEQHVRVARYRPQELEAAILAEARRRQVQLGRSLTKEEQEQVGKVINSRMFMPIRSAELDVVAIEGLSDSRDSLDSEIYSKADQSTLTEEDGLHQKRRRAEAAMVLELLRYSTLLEKYGLTINEIDAVLWWFEENDHDGNPIASRPTQKKAAERAALSEDQFTRRIEKVRRILRRLLADEGFHHASELIGIGENSP